MRNNSKPTKTTKLLATMLICALVITAIPFTALADNNDYSTVAVYRAYNPFSGEHFYTTNQVEYNYLTTLGWQGEDVASYTSTISNAPLFRMLNPNTGGHHYARSEAERDFLVDKGWKYEGIAFYSFDSNATPVYRLYNPNATGDKEAGGHHYTEDRAEADYLVSIGWQDEGIGWYGASRENPYIDVLKNYLTLNGETADDGSHYITTSQTIDGTPYSFFVIYHPREDDNSISYMIVDDSEDSSSTWIKPQLTMSINENLGEYAYMSYTCTSTESLDPYIGVAPTIKKDLTKDTTIDFIPTAQKDNDKVQQRGNELLGLGMSNWNTMLNEKLGFGMNELGFESYEWK